MCLNLLIVAISDTDKATWRRIKKLFPHTKHRSDYPAVKIGRLGVDKEFRGQHIGSDILRSAIPFYIRNGFVVLDRRLLEDESQETCPLYYNLFELIQ